VPCSPGCAVPPPPAAVPRAPAADAQRGGQRRRCRCSSHSSSRCGACSCMRSRRSGTRQARRRPRRHL
jgi:hypothetical protein